MERKKKLFTGNRQNQKQKAILIGFAASLAVGFLIYLGLSLTGNLAFTGKVKAVPAIHGDKTVASGSVILNEYTYLTFDAAVSSTQIWVASNSLNSNSRFSGPLVAGELIMIIQMQGASISETNASSYGSISNYNNCGKYEFAEVAGLVSSNRINLVAGLTKSYSALGTVQIIRVPRYQNLTINNGATVTCPAWNGTNGGIVALEVNGTATINGIIDVSAKGFRGGATDQNSFLPGEHSDWRSTDSRDGGEKGESIAGYQLDYWFGRYGRGAPANGGGGGNSHNAAGGGGSNGNNGVAWNGKGIPDNSFANWTTAWNLEGGSFSTNNSSGGGRGGYSFSNDNLNPVSVAPNNSSWDGDNRYNVGGYGGHPLDYSTGRIFLGGGGGAGDSNNNKGTGGGDGGGLIYILAGKNVTGTGSMKANGEDAAMVNGTSWLDGTGGGGGGGTIIVYSKGGNVSNLTFEAKGGKGGDWNNTSPTNEAEGAGGGGGGGYISLTGPTGITQSVAGGSQGENKNSIMSNFKPNGGTRGASGQTASNPPNPYSGTVPLPVSLTSFSGNAVSGSVNLEWTTATEKNNSFFTIERSADGHNYKAIGKVEGAGNSTQKRSYSFVDKTPFEEINYYRLSQTDMNGQSISFQPVAVELRKQSGEIKSTIGIYPNPFSDAFTLKTNFQLPKGTVKLKLTDLQGKVIQDKEENLAEGTNAIEFDKLNNLPQGIYMLNIIQSDGTAANVKLIKK